MSAPSKPFPLDGGRVGMGVITASAGALIKASLAPPALTPKNAALTPIPGPSPIKGEGRGSLR